MNKIINDQAFENMMEDLFSIEECKKTKEDDDQELNLDEEIINTLSDKEKEIVNDIPEDDIALELITEESIKVENEITCMDIALQAAEEYLWKSSFEADSVDPSIWKKFWEWIKTIFNKIKEYLLITFKKIQIWISNDFKTITKWAIENKEDITKAISAKGDITLKIKKPIRNPLTVNVSESFITNEFKKAVIDFEKGIVDESIIPKIENFYKEYPVNYFEETIYGKDSKIEDVKLSDFDKVIKIVDTLINKSGEIKNKLSNSITKINQIIKDIKDFVKDKNLTNYDKEHVAKMKKFASVLQKFYSHSASSIYWKFSIQISIVKISKAYATKALNQYKAENK